MEEDEDDLYAENGVPSAKQNEPSNATNQDVDDDEEEDMDEDSSDSDIEIVTERPEGEITQP